MKPNYNNFLKTWSTENKITSFFGSDKPDFLKAWGDVKNQAVKKKEVIMKPKEEEARNNRMKPKQIIIQDEPKETEDFMTVIKDGKKRIVMDEPKEEYPDIISSELQKIIYITSLDKIKKALVDINFKGRMNTNKVLLNLQLLQNLDINKQKELINKLKS